MVGKNRESLYGSTDRGILQAIGLAVVNFSQLEEWLALGSVFPLPAGRRAGPAERFLDISNSAPGARSGTPDKLKPRGE